MISQNVSNSGQLKKTYCFRWMYIIGFILYMGMINTSCEKDKTETINDEYYVKYIVNSSTKYIGGKLNVSINSESNKEMNFIINQRTPWDIIIGPVGKEFNAILKVNSEYESSDLRINTSIEVSKNDSPFALKKSNSTDDIRNSVKLNYIIDY